MYRSTYTIHTRQHQQEDFTDKKKKKNPPWVAFLYIGGQHPRPGDPGLSDCLCTKDTIEMIEVCCPHGSCVCPLPITTQPSFKSLSYPVWVLLQSQIDVTAVVIWHTLQCQQQPQDKRIRSSVVLCLCATKRKCFHSAFKPRSWL